MKCTEIHSARDLIRVLQSYPPSTLVKFALTTDRDILRTDAGVVAKTEIVPHIAILATEQHGCPVILAVHLTPVVRDHNHTEVRRRPDTTKIDIDLARLNADELVNLALEELTKLPAKPPQWMFQPLANMYLCGLLWGLLNVANPGDHDAITAAVQVVEDAVEDCFGSMESTSPDIN
jgi:hypothetical protein